MGYGNVYRARTLSEHERQQNSAEHEGGHWVDTARERQDEMLRARSLGSGILPDEFADSSARHVAVKCFDLDPTPQEGEDEDQAHRKIASRRASFERERALLASFEHPHIVKMYECFEFGTRLWIVLELCSGGELYHCVQSMVNKTRGGALDEGMGRTIFRQMLHAASYLHFNHVVHRDVKTENFLLLEKKGSAHEHFVKLCDFGTAVRLNAAQPRAFGCTGTLAYVAPEVYTKKG